MKQSILIAAAVIGSFTANAQTWSVDNAHSSVGFTFTHLNVSEMRGSFDKYDVKLGGTKEDMSDMTIEFSAETNSINTGNANRDKHLASADFFDAEKNPNITFKSTSIKRNGKTFKVTGDLTMHGVTKSVTLDATVNGKTVNPNSKKDVYGLKVTGNVKRSDFNVAKDMPNDMVSDIVKLDANLEVVKN